jgi:Malectin domain
VEAALFGGSTNPDSHLFSLLLDRCSFTTPNSRVFDVDIENARAFNDIDLVLIAGSGYTAVTRTTTVLVLDGALTVRLLDNVPGINYPLISALEVRAVAPPTTPAAPMRAPTNAPVAAPVRAPSAAPVKAPVFVAAPTRAPVTTTAPVAAVPVKEPSAPLTAPVATTAPIRAPGAAMAPTRAPLSIPAMQPILINCGFFEKYSDKQGRTWSEDKYFIGGNLFATDATIRDLAGRPLDDSEIYHTTRWGPHSYDIPVPNGGLYEVVLHFAEV